MTHDYCRILKQDAWEVAKPWMLKFGFSISHFSQTNDTINGKRHFRIACPGNFAWQGIACCATAAYANALKAWARWVEEGWMKAAERSPEPIQINAIPLKVVAVVTSSLVPEYEVYRKRAEDDKETHVATFTFFADAWWWAVEKRSSKPEDTWTFSYNGRRVHLPDQSAMAFDDSLRRFEEALRFLGVC